MEMKDFIKKVPKNKQLIVRCQCLFSFLLTWKLYIHNRANQNNQKQFLFKKALLNELLYPYCGALLIKGILLISLVHNIPIWVTHITYIRTNNWQYFVIWAKLPSSIIIYNSSISWHSTEYKCYFLIVNRI